MITSAHHRDDRRITVLAVVFLLIAVGIIGRLFYLQILRYDYYATAALDAHEISKKLYPTRGAIYFRDTRSSTIYPAAVNKEYFLIYAIPKSIPVTDIASTTDALSQIVGLTDAERSTLSVRLANRNSSYAVVAKKQSEETLEKIKAANIPGVSYVSSRLRYYPEGDLAGNVLGFTGFDDNGGLIGSYGIEGFWNKTLAGQGGFMSGEFGAKGGWITLADRTVIDPVDGADVILTIDRSLEFKACALIRDSVKEYGAKTGALILLNSKTGAILAMCSVPDFDPNNYAKVADESQFNNTTIFTPYEPGSVFKPIAMSMALDLGLVSPTTPFSDPCRRVINGYEIRNALDKCYGDTTMTGVLENSINTGMIAVEEKIGKEKFKEYVDKFGFGEKIGIDMNTEAKGNVSQLEKGKKSDVGYATASFGQGITVTPLQLAAAYSALANGGAMPLPYIVDEVRYADGRRDQTEPKIIDQIISPRASKLISGMLTSVVEKTYWRTVKLPEYLVAAKTGTAQIPGPGGYTDETNHTLAGYFPANDPQFVLIVKYEKPHRQWAEGTAGPTFRQMADFTLKYYGVAGTR